jgi:hypothetical protein
MKIMTNNKTDSKKTFHAIFSEMLSDRMRVLTDDKSRKLDRTFCIECYSIIFHAVEDILKAVNVGIENEGANWISQGYYDCVSLNGNEANGLDPNIFTQRASLKNIGNVELVKMFAILRGSPFALEIAQEIKSRN